MRFRLIGRNEQTQSEVVRDIVCDSQEDAEAFAVFDDGILVERIEPLPDSPGAPESTDASDRATPLMSSEGAARAQEVGHAAELGAAPLVGLPAPLDDPLRALQRFLGWLMLVQIAFAVYSLTLREHRGGTLELLVGSILLTFSFWRLLPNQPVNAFYLRSFRHDPATSAMHKTSVRPCSTSRPELYPSGSSSFCISSWSIFCTLLRATKTDATFMPSAWAASAPDCPCSAVRSNASHVCGRTRIRTRPM